MHSPDRNFDFATLINDVKRVNCITVGLFVSNLKHFIRELDRVSTGNDFDRMVTRVHLDGFALARCIVTRGPDTLLDDDPYIPPLREIMVTSLESLSATLSEPCGLRAQGAS